MRKTRKAAAVLTAVAMAAVSAAPVRHDDLRICMITRFRQKKLRLGTFYSLS